MPDAVPSRKNYTYRVVSTNGHGVHGRDWETCAAARGAMLKIAASFPLPDQFFEIERVEHIDQWTRSYQMRQGSRWVPWDSHRDFNARQPDWFATSKEATPVWEEAAAIERTADV